LEKSLNEIYILDLETLSYLYVNEGACKRLGYTKEEFYKMDVFDINPYLKKEYAQKIKNELLEKGSVLNRTIHKTKDGELYSVQSYLQTITYKGIEAFIIFDTDIESLIELEKKQKEQAKIVENINDGVISTDIYANVKNLNKASKKILGYDEIDNIEDIYISLNDISLKELLVSIVNCEDDCSKELEVWFRKDNGEKIICDLSLTQLKDENNNLYGIIWLFQDITEKKEKEKLLLEQAKQLEHQAHHDALTNLPNRTLFRDRLQQAIFHSKRNDKKFALFFIDLDRFKQINDSFGHHFGDKVLLEVTKRLQEVIREEDTLARLGGDEFTIIAKDINNIEDASIVAMKIINSLKTSMKIESQEVYTSISVGISIYPDDSTDEANLIKFADSAMYKAKEEGRDNFQFYSSDMTDNAFEKVVIENSLRSAIENEEFEVYFQPQINSKTDELIGVEALARWIHPDIGLIPPSKFISVAEESGLITKIDRIIMRKAMQNFSRWKKDGFNIPKLSLNLATKQLLEEDFLDLVRKNFSYYDFETNWLEFEVTESDIMRNPTRSIEVLSLLHNIGIGISIDDFGTGYSSLSYLTKLPLDKIKIDKSFVMDIPKNPHSMEIVSAIIVLSKSLDLDVIAEGVETKEQKDFLQENGCINVQGYYYSKPLSVKEFEKFLKN
jgi:diguanylate cyclase (GGDEF)-like protein/PAS domain S-box-containing protein